ncbi:MAG: rod-binding protein [Polyangiaceae bacterium]
MNPLHAVPSGIATDTKSATDAAAPASAHGQKEILKAAREFEAIFLRTLLAPLEKTTQVGKGGSMSAGQSAYGSMVVGAMADTLSSQGGIGLAEVIARALGSHGSGQKP